MPICSSFWSISRIGEMRICSFLRRFFVMAVSPYNFL
jgi:hypothetical protein